MKLGTNSTFFFFFASVYPTDRFHIVRKETCSINLKIKYHQENYRQGTQDKKMERRTNDDDDKGYLTRIMNMDLSKRTITMFSWNYVYREHSVPYSLQYYTNHCKEKHQGKLLFSKDVSTLKCLLYIKHEITNKTNNSLYLLRCLTSFLSSEVLLGSKQPNKNSQTSPLIDG